MGLSSSSRRVALNALFEKLKGVIERRVACSNGLGSCQSSWSVMEELKGCDEWKGDKFDKGDEERRDRALAGHQASIDKCKKEEEEIWFAIGELLKD